MLLCELILSLQHVSVNQRAESRALLLAGVLIKACETWHNTCRSHTKMLVLSASKCPSDVSFLCLSAPQNHEWGIVEGIQRLFLCLFFSLFLVFSHTIVSISFRTHETSLSTSITPKSPNFCVAYILPDFSRAVKFEQISPQDCDTWNQPSSCSPEEASIID